MINKNYRVRGSGYKGKVDQKIIFDIYKQIPFSLNTLINAKNVYQTFEPVDARSLIFRNIYYRKILSLKWIPISTRGFV